MFLRCVVSSLVEFSYEMKQWPSILVSRRFYFHVFKIVMSYKVQIKYLFSMLNFIFLCFLGVLYLVWLNFHMK
jgi:hypothetical protein